MGRKKQKACKGPEEQQRPFSLGYRTVKTGLSRAARLFKSDKDAEWQCSFRAALRGRRDESTKDRPRAPTGYSTEQRCQEVDAEHKAMMLELRRYIKDDVVPMISEVRISHPMGSP